jgi:hypothetical protein
MTKFRSNLNYATQYASLKNGYMIGIDQRVFAKLESTPGTAVVPALLTQGSSTSAASPSTNISASSNIHFGIAVDGATSIQITTVNTGLNTGALIAAYLETTINAALSAAGQDGRVWVQYTTVYIISSQKGGVTSSVVITAGTTLDLAATLGLGLANSGVEVSGTNGVDYLDCYSFKHKLAQVRQGSKSRTGRQNFGVIKKKKMLEGTLESYINVNTSLSAPAVDNAVDLMLQNALGTKLTDGATYITYNMQQAPSKYFTLLNGTNVSAALLNGCYNKSLEIDLPGDSEAKYKLTFKGRDEKVSSVCQVNGAVSASATIVVNSGEAYNTEPSSLVMCVDVDGRTVLYGYDGSLSVSSITNGSNTIVLSSPVTLSSGAYLVPYNPAVLGNPGGTLQPLVGLTGSVSFNGGSTTLEQVRSVNIVIDQKLSDLDKFYGFDTNRGYVVGSEAEIKVKIETLCTPSEINRILQIKSDTNFSMQIVLGSASGRRVQISCPSVIYQIPAIEIPDSGEVPITFEGIAQQSSLGAMDAISISYL